MFSLTETAYQKNLVKSTDYVVVTPKTNRSLFLIDHLQKLSLKNKKNVWFHQLSAFHFLYILDTLQIKTWWMHFTILLASLCVRYFEKKSLCFLHILIDTESHVGMLNETLT